MKDTTTESAVRSLYSGRWTRCFVGIATRAFGRSVDAQALSEDARQRLAIRLSRLGAAEAPRLSDAYILVAFKHALIDAYREFVGRPVPRKWLRELGALGVRLFELRCLLRLPQSDVLAALRQDPMLAKESAVDEAEVRRLLNEIERRQECQGHASERVSLDVPKQDGQGVPEPADSGADPAEHAARDQADTLRRLLYGEAAAKLAPGARRRPEQLYERGQPSLPLDDQEYFILRCFRDGVPDQRVGDLLGGLSVRQVRYRRQQALDMVRRCFAKAGITLDDLLD